MLHTWQILPVTTSQSEKHCTQRLEQKNARIRRRESLHQSKQGQRATVSCVTTLRLNLRHESLPAMDQMQHVYHSPPELRWVQTRTQRQVGKMPRLRV